MGHPLFFGILHHGSGFGGGRFACIRRAGEPIPEHEYHALLIASTYARMSSVEAVTPQDMLRCKNEFSQDYS